MPNPFMNNLTRGKKAGGPSRIPDILMPRSLKEVISTAILPVSRDEKPRWSQWNTQKAIEEGYKGSTWVYSAVSRLATASASPPWLVEEAGDGENQPAKPVDASEPLPSLLARPNPFMSMNDIVRRGASHLYLGGNCIITKIRAGDAEEGKAQPVAELWPLHPGFIAPVPSRTDFIKEYVMKKKDGGRPKKLKVEDVIHIQLVDPDDPTWGMSPLQAASKTVDADIQAVTWNMVAMQNRSIPDGVFTLDVPMTREQWEEARDMVKEQYQGGTDSANARTPWVLGNGAAWTQMSLSPAEMDFIESRKLTREEILSVFGVPPPLVGLYEQATLANIKTAREIFWLDTIIPFMDIVKEALNRSLIPDFYDEDTAKGIEIRYDLSNVDALQENLGDKMETAEGMWEMGMPWSIINEVLELGLKPWVGWDVPYVPTNMMPAGEATGVDDAMGGIL